MAKLRVGVVFGGRSVEHEVSIASATSIVSALDPARPIDIYWNDRRISVVLAP